MLIDLCGVDTGEYRYFIKPHEGGWLVRLFSTNRHLVTRDVRRLSHPGAEVSSIIALRHAIQNGMFRDGSGLEGAPASAVASGCLSLLADEVRNGGDPDPNRYLVLLNPVSGQPVRLVRTRVDGHDLLAEPERTWLAPSGSPTARASSRHPGAARRAFSSIAAEPSMPSTSAPGQRCFRNTLTLPGPQPRSTTRAGASASTFASKSSAGRSRSSP